MLNQILIQCQHLLHLTHFNFLKCEFEKTKANALHFMNKIWCLSKLTHCNLDNIFRYDILFKNMTVISQSIECLSIVNTYRPLSILFDILKCTPRLRQVRANAITFNGSEHCFIINIFNEYFILRFNAFDETSFSKFT